MYFEQRELEEGARHGYEPRSVAGGFTRPVRHDINAIHAGVKILSSNDRKSRGGVVSSSMCSPLAFRTVYTLRGVYYMRCRWLT